MRPARSAFGCCTSFHAQGASIDPVATTRLPARRFDVVHSRHNHAEGAFQDLATLLQATRTREATMSTTFHDSLIGAGPPALTAIATALLLLFARSSITDGSVLPQASQPLAGSSHCTGPVLETMNAAGYTYVRVDCGEARIWAAGPQAAVSVADEVVIPLDMPMKDFHSDALRRDFDWVFFVTHIQRVEDIRDDETTRATIARAHGGDAGDEKPAVDFSRLERPDGGKTISEIFTDKQELTGKRVLVRAKVIRFTEGVLGKNWIHIQDGSGRPGSNDLTVTTEQRVRVGDAVLVRGTVALDRDFGLGYRYDVLLEDAAVTVE